MLYYPHMTKKQNILWIDLEMTGLEPAHDRILEVAAIVTNWKFEELAVYEAIVHVDPALMQQRMVGEFWETYSDVRSALIDQNTKGKSAETVESELMTLCGEYFADDEPVLLAGNSIHQDRRFIRNEWARLDKRLHYRMLDVSAWKVVFEGKYGKKFAKPEEHRALGDIRGSIMELKYYLSKFKEAS